MARAVQILIAAASIAIAVSILLYFPDRDDGSGAVLGGFSALVASALGLAAVARARPLPRRTAAEHLWLTALALSAGVVVGIANLGANYSMSLMDRTIREQMVTRWAEFSSWSVVVVEPIMEEIAYRLVLLGGLAWIVSRFTDNRRTIAYLALGVSALLFGVAHVFYGGVDAPLYAVGMAVKSSAGGVAFGWVFWRWGLPYSIVCHCVANATHLLLMPALF
jgi:membrane protease YdiL (CAAX protease family)